MRADLSALSLRVFGVDITVAGRQAAATADAAEKQGTTKKENEEDVALGLEDASFLRQTDRTTEGAPKLESGEQRREDEFAVIITDGGAVNK